MSSPLILHKTIFCGIDAITVFIRWLKFFIALHNDSVAQQTFFVATLSHGTATFILTCKSYYVLLVKRS